ncbi:hypothetical protein DPMN_035153 [Dreissena polymorpha]|uniref:Uncharacterized protein n=1 Tax=Dreissena polymorpha TaxID=45954 RepID=A0A9D4M8P7_DREPO|nr:hypothetical protein DPMN_035153 [Dreissena polymorpha]
MPREVTEKSSYLNRTGSVFYIGRNCEEFFYWLSNLGRCCSSIVKKAPIQYHIHVFDLCPAEHGGMCVLGADAMPMFIVMT